jgi:hypothetical protein
VSGIQTADQTQHQSQAGDDLSPSENVAETALQRDTQLESLSRNSYANGGDGLSFDQYMRQQGAQQAAENDGFVMVNQGPTNQLSREEIEEKKREQSAEALEGMVEAGEERRKKDWAERWDNAMSQDFPDLTNAEVLQSIKRINKDPKKAADDAVKRGDIGADQKDDFIAYMKLYEQQQEYKRNHPDSKGTPFDAQMNKIDAASGGAIKPAAKAAVQYDQGIEKSQSAKITADGGYEQKGIAVKSRDDVFDTAPLPGDPLKGSEKAGFATAAFSKVAPDVPPQSEQNTIAQPQVTASVEKQVSSPPRPTAAALAC